MCFFYLKVSTLISIVLTSWHKILITNHCSLKAESWVESSQKCKLLVFNGFLLSPNENWHLVCTEYTGVSLSELRVQRIVNAIHVQALIFLRLWWKGGDVCINIHPVFTPFSMNCHKNAIWFGVYYVHIAYRTSANKGRSRLEATPPQGPS